MLTLQVAALVILLTLIIGGESHALPTAPATMDMKGRNPNVI